jgi:sphingomyelin phosphodiesterase acid-like 3
MFLSSEYLADELAGSAPDLVLFAHTHMDELRLLVAGDPADPATPAAPVKLVPSISPANGNRPSFIVALVDPATATLADYTVYAATDAHGTSWQREYSFSETYGRTGFTAANLRPLLRGMQADIYADQPASKAYMRNFTSGALTEELKPFWPDYTCALTNDHAIDFLHCACGR